MPAVQSRSAPPTRQATTQSLMLAELPRTLMVQMKGLQPTARTTERADQPEAHRDLLKPLRAGAHLRKERVFPPPNCPRAARQSFPEPRTRQERETLQLKAVIQIVSGQRS